MKKILLSLVFILSACSQVISKIDTATTENKSTNQKLHLVFSHNISGETHPCGCRQFPLGGLPQVLGLFSNLQKEGELLYVDTGDTFFPSSNIPKTMNSSLSFAANNLANAMDEIGLKYFVPGDQDFALGIDFLKNIANTHHFSFLISNLKDESTIKHEKMAIITRGENKIFLIGLVNPEAINTKEVELFKNVNDSMIEINKELVLAGFDQNNKKHRLIILSHAGIDLDSNLAQLNPNIDWIIGAHSQSFLRYSQDVGNVKIVQTLSKNHYVGDINIDLGSKKDLDSYTLHEIRDELEQKVTPNPMRDFINAHKSKMAELQLKEQEQMSKFSEPTSTVVKKFQSPTSCIQCHKPQVEFWQSTPHSLAYATLMNVKEQTNLQCIKCHSVGLNNPKGFTNSKNIIQFKKQPIIDYWNQAHALSEKVTSVRKLTANEIKAISKKWAALDSKSAIKHNFANVQCLNCHDKHDEHPFEIEPTIPSDLKVANMKSKCLTCHTSDQSPEWYNKGEKGLPSTPNDKHINTQFKKMSCPLLQ